MKTRPYYGAIALILALATVLRVVAIPLFGNGLHGNPVDVYYVDKEAARLVLGLKDPYLYSNYTNHVGGIVTFSYLPLIPVYYSAFVLIGADIRFGNILADLATTVALFFIGRSMQRTASSNPWLPFSGSLVYAILPPSIWLSAVTGSNLMIGSMFLMVALALLVEGRHMVSSVFLGLALATNQFMLLVFPVVALYYIRIRQPRPVLASALVAGGIVLPFLLYSPSRFIYDVLLFQFERPLQSNGPLSLYSILYNTTGFSIDTLSRSILFVIAAAPLTFLFSMTRTRMLIGIAVVGALGAFLLPVDGFWSYFLLPMTMVCAFVPAMLTFMAPSANGEKFLPRITDADRPAGPKEECAVVSGQTNATR